MSYKPTNNIELKPGRRVGNTTRIIDNAIQLLFEDGDIEVRDHYNSHDSNNQLLSMILRRLELEHPDILHYLIIDKKNQIISFRK